MKKLFICVLLVIFFGNTVSANVGFGPAEMYVTNNPDTHIIGNATLINGDDVGKYGVFQLMMPFSDKDTFQISNSEIMHARVLCNDCGKSMQRKDVSEYNHERLEGYCPVCQSDNLVFYDVLPRDELQMLSVIPSGGFHLKKIDDYTWVTEEKISPHGYCNINILYNSVDSYLPSYFGEHWEFHLRGKTKEGDGNDFITGGLDLRVLLSFKFPLDIELCSDVVKGEEFTVNIRVTDEKNSFYNELKKPVTVEFNGETKRTDSEGKVSFMMPESRFDYNYTVHVLESDLYLSENYVVSHGIQMFEKDFFGFFSFFQNIYVIISLCVIGVLSCIIILYIRKNYVWE